MYKISPENICVIENKFLINSYTPIGTITPPTLLNHNMHQHSDTINTTNTQALPKLKGSIITNNNSKL
jgi:hypothetical protein